MVDNESAKPEAEKSFATRWEQALQDNGVTQAQIAKAIGEYGSQNIRSWKDRGHIGGPSLRMVSQLLPRTSMDWLQYGEGPRERLSAGNESSLNHDLRQSYAARLDPATIRDVHTGLSWRFQFDLGMSYDLDRDADLFALAYAFSVSGAEEDRIAMKEAVDARIVQLAGEIQSGKPEEAPRRARSGESN